MSRYLTGTVTALVAVGALALGGVAGVDAARPGIIMEAHPRVGDVYQQEYYTGHAEDMEPPAAADHAARLAARLRDGSTP